MTEKEFWLFLNGALARGRAMVTSEVMACEPIEGPERPADRQAGRFLAGHAFLPEDCEKIPAGKIAEMEGLLLREGVSFHTKEAIMILLAHHPSNEALRILKIYNSNPDKELEFFAQMALDECEMWNEE